MKDTKVCPKCESLNIKKFDRYYASGGLAYIYVRTSSFGGVEVRLYICSDCGYTETWIDKKDLTKIKDSKYAQKI